MDKQMQELLEATNRFFENSVAVAKRVNDRHVFFKEIAVVSQDDIDRYGEALIPACLVGLKLQLKSSNISEICPDGNLNSGSMRMFTMQVLREIDYIRGLILAFRSRGTYKLFEILSGQDEDLGLLASICLADSIFENPEISTNLNKAIQRARGTAYKFTLSFALFMRGDRSHFETIQKEFNIERGNIIPISILEIVSSGNAYSGRVPWTRNATQ